MTVASAKRMQENVMSKLGQKVKDGGPGAREARILGGLVDFRIFFSFVSFFKCKYIFVYYIKIYMTIFKICHLVL